MRKGLRKAVDKGLKKHEFDPGNGSSSQGDSADSKSKTGNGNSKPKKRTVIVVPKPSLDNIRAGFFPKPGTPRKWYKNPILWILVAVVVGALVFQQYKATPSTEITLGEAVTYIKEEQIEEAKVNHTRVVLELKDETSVYAVITDKEGFRQALVEQEAPQDKVFFVEDDASWVDIVSTLVYVAMLGGIIFFAVSISRQMGKGGSGILGMGESRAKVWLGKKQEIGFKDVAGAEDAVDEVKEIVEFLKSPQKFRKLGARIPKGVLIVGAPGTGKTLMARAIAGEAGVPFFFTSGSEFEEMLVGAGASRVRDLFEKAKKASPSIIFIDEIDAVGRKRGTVMHTGTAEQTLNQILVEMDGFDKKLSVIIIAATNRPDVLDPALLRPGRFDRIITLDLPDIAARKEILKVHSEGKPIGEDVNMETVARRTVGFSGADLENLLNEAAILAARREKEEITMPEITEAVSKVQLGPAKKRMQSDKEKEMIAYHEAGHALVSHYMPDADEVLRVSIVSRGLSLGATESLPKEEHERIRTKSKIEADITTLVSGHVTEKVVFKETSTGAENDIKVATRLARAMVTKFGMSELGPIELGEGDDSSKFLGYDYSKKPYSETTASKVDEAVSNIINGACKRAEELIVKHRDGLDRIVKALLEKENLDAEEFVSILEGKNTKEG